MTVQNEEIDMLADRPEDHEIPDHSRLASWWLMQADQQVREGAYVTEDDAKHVGTMMNLAGLHAQVAAACAQVTHVQNISYHFPPPDSGEGLFEEEEPAIPPVVDTPAPTPAPSPVTPEPPGSLLVLDSSGPAATWTHSNTKADRSTPFYVENNGGKLLRTGGVFRQPSLGGFRAWTQRPYGGPGQRIRIRVPVRVLAFGGAPGGVVEGFKMMVKAVHPEHPQGIADPDAARGIYPWNVGPSGKSVTPGSMYATAVTHNGRLEIMKRHCGTDQYEFPINATHPCKPGQWYDVAVELEWLTGPDRVRITSFRDGVRLMSWEDKGQPGKGNAGGGPFMWPVFAGVRSDDASFEMGDFVIEPLGSRRDDDPAL